jgi:hypothetical protein
MSESRRRTEPHPRDAGEIGEEWKVRSACQDLPAIWWAHEDDRALPVCKSCPVSGTCLTYCLEVVGRKVPGIWGGTTFAERNPTSTPPGVIRGPGGHFLKKT